MIADEGIIVDTSENMKTINDLQPSTSTQKPNSLIPLAPVSDLPVSKINIVSLHNYLTKCLHYIILVLQNVLKRHPISLIGII